jgi:hypothetical protein
LKTRQPEATRTWPLSAAVSEQTVNNWHLSIELPEFRPWQSMAISPADASRDGGREFTREWVTKPA